MNGQANRLALGTRDSNRQEKFERIVQAAREAFSARGYAGTTLREVALAAGVASGTVFLYAPTKETLLCIVFKRELTPVIDRSFETMPGGDAQEKLIHIFNAVADHHQANMALSSQFLKEFMFVEEPLRSEMAAFMKAWVGRIAEIFVEAQRSGALRPETDATRLAQCCMRQFLGLLRQWVSGRSTRAVFDAELPLCTDMLLCGHYAVPAESAARRVARRRDWSRKRT